MTIIEVIVGDVKPTEVNKIVEDHIKAHNTGDRDNKAITGTNIKATMGNFTTLMEIIITTIITVITHMDMAMEVIITDLAVMDEVIIRAIIIINTNSITHMMMVHN